MPKRHKPRTRHTESAAAAPQAVVTDNDNPADRRRRRPVRRFVVLFAVFMAASYALTATPWFECHGWVPYLQLNARVSGSLLNVFGEDATVISRTVASPRAAISIERGCDAIHPTALFISAILASPAGWRRKLLGAAVGTAILMLTNLIRIVTLFYVKVYWPALFEMMHVEVWQVLFIFLALLLFVLWALWAVRPRVESAHAAG